MSANNILRWVAPGLILVLLSILVQRKLYKRFPAFFCYCLSIVCITVVRFLADGQPTRYFFVYWSTEACYLVIAFIAILSVLRPLTELEYVRHPWSRFILVPFLLMTAMVAFWTAVFKPINRTIPGRIASAIYVFVILMCLAELLLFVVSFNARRRAIEWTQYEFGILKGFGALTFLNLLAYLALLMPLFHWTVTPQLEKIFQAFPIGAFIASEVIWLNAFWRPEPPHPESADIGSFIDALNVVLEQYQAQAEFLKRLARHLGLRFAVPKHS